MAPSPGPALLRPHPDHVSPTPGSDLNSPDTSLRSVCVFCGSTAGEDARYLQAAATLGSVIASRGLRLVYGGSRLGLMGRLAESALEAGGEVIGVIPRALMNREVAHPGLAELVVTESMHQRKSEMVDRADAFIAAPGGLGTLEEFFEVLTWSQLGLHQKPCGLLDVRGYYKPLIRLLDHALQEGFIQEAHRRMILVDQEAIPLLDRIGRYVPPEVPQWIGQAET